jgi:hypothetical protein
VQRLVADVHGLVRPHRQRLADRLGGALGSHRQDGHVAPDRLFDLERFLDGVLVHLVDDVVRRTALDSVVGRAQRAFGTRVRDLFDQYDDVHRASTTLL